MDFYSFVSIYVRGRGCHTAQWPLASVGLPYSVWFSPCSLFSFSTENEAFSSLRVPIQQTGSLPLNEPGIKVIAPGVNHHFPSWWLLQFTTFIYEQLFLHLGSFIGLICLCMSRISLMVTGFVHVVVAGFVDKPK